MNSPAALEATSRCILVYMPADFVLTIRVPKELSARLTREARRLRRSRSAVARDLLAQSLGYSGAIDLAAEARRQSLLVRRRRSEREALALIAAAADWTDWR